MLPVAAARSCAAGWPRLASLPWPTRLEAGPYARIAVFRALQLGDLLCAVPALRALRTALPEARLVLVGLPWAESFARRFARYLDGFLPFPGAPGLPERAASAEESARFLQRARAARFDAAIQAHGSGLHSNRIVLDLGAPVCAGFHPVGLAPPDPRRFMPWPEEASEVDRLLRLFEFLGVPRRGEGLEFPVTDEEWLAGAGWRRRLGLRPGAYACLHPGARAAARRWEPERFAQVADALAGRGLRILLSGTPGEAPIVERVAAAMRAPALRLSDHDTGLGPFAALLAGARVLVSNDTGVSHIAAALGVPSVIIYTASSPGRWAPPAAPGHRVVVHPISCRPCAHEVCPIGHPCSSEVRAEQVIAEAEGLLQRDSASVSGRHAGDSRSRKACDDPAS